MHPTVQLSARATPDVMIRNGGGRHAAESADVITGMRIPYPIRLLFNYRDDCKKALARGETPTSWSEYRRTWIGVRCEFIPRYGLIELGRDIGALITTGRRAEAR